MLQLLPQSVELSSPNIQPGRLSLPDFLKPRIPLVSIGRIENRPGFTAEFIEPHYDHPEFQTAFSELNELLVAEFDGDPVVEFMDLMMYGFWGEGHTGGRPNPFPDYLTAERTFVEMTRLQLEAWKRVALVVNTQPDISRTGNREMHDMAVRGGSWLRSDSIILDEPIQIEMLANRPPWLPVIMENGYKRRHSLEPDQVDLDGAGVPYLERAAQLAIDLGANCWALWTESDNLSKFNERYPALFPHLRNRLGYRLRPGWVWQRKRYEAVEVIAAISNDVAAGVPGVLRLTAESLDGRFRRSGCLDAGHPHGGRIRQGAFVQPRDFFGRRIRLRAVLEAKGGIRKPVRWACAQPLDADGSVVVRGDAHACRRGLADRRIGAGGQGSRVDRRNRCGAR